MTLPAGGGGVGLPNTAKLEDEIARLHSLLESAHALLDEWTSYHKAELRARTRELLDRETDAADELMALVGAAEALAEDVECETRDSYGDSPDGHVTSLGGSNT